MRSPLSSTLPTSIETSRVLAALSFALDLTEGQPLGHSLRSCGIALDIAKRAGLPPADVRTLYHAVLLKDAGCSSNAARVFELFGGDDHDAKRNLKLVDWSRYFEAARYALAQAAPGSSWHERALRMVSIARAGPAAANELVELRCRRGSDIALRLGFGADVALAIASLDEHWDGNGRPARLRGAEIPLAARIMLLAQTLDVFTWHKGPYIALEIATQRSGRWFDPELVRAARALAPELAAWRACPASSLQHAVQALDPAPELRLEGEGALARVAEAFAWIVDTKSPFTERHSRRVAEITIAMAEEVGMASEMFRISALLHDLGKLAVPNSILDKPSSLTAGEWEIMKRHPLDSFRILERLEWLGEWSGIAAAHHERLDGRGYHLGLQASEITRESRILAVADVYESLTANRPYRGPLDRESASAILERERGSALDGECVDLLLRVVDGLEHPSEDPQADVSRAA